MKKYIFKMQPPLLTCRPEFNAQLKFAALKIIVYININGCGKLTHTTTLADRRCVWGGDIRIIIKKIIPFIVINFNFRKSFP